jgi:hypothetical protein
MRAFWIAIVVVGVSGVASGCAVPLITDKYAREQDCVKIQKSKVPPGKYTDDQLYQVSRMWNGQKLLDNQGNYKGPAPQPTTPPPG